MAADEPLVELETDKVTLEVNAPAAGVVKEIRAESGATVEVGAILGIVESGSAPAAAAAQPAAAAAPAASSAPSPAPAPSPSPAAPPPPAAAPSALDPNSAGRSGEGGKIGKAELLQFLSASGAAHDALSPAVRKMVGDHGLDAGQIPGSGKDGRITKGDVQAYLAAGTPAPPAPAVPAAPATAAPAPPISAPGPTEAAAPREERVAMSRLRKTVASRLKEAQNTAAILTTFNEADMSAVMALRARYRESFEKKHGVRLGFTSFFAKAVVAALQEIRAVNAEIDGDDIVYKNHYDIGMAVSTPSGLMVPVVRDCDAKSFAEIEAALAELAGRGRDGKLSMEEMTGGTFTITNGGVFGSLLSTPILNRPQSAILGLHKIQQRPMVVDGKVEARPMMYLALSYDHRIIDGREAVTFLVRVKEGIEDPERLLIGM